MAMGRFTPGSRTYGRGGGRAVHVLVVDDRDNQRDRMLSMVRGQREIEVRARTASTADAVGAVIATRADIALVGTARADRTALGVCQAIEDLGRSVRSVFLTSDRSERSVRAALRAGARAYLLESATELDLGRTLRNVMDGWLIVSHPVAQHIRRMIAPADMRSPIGAGVPRLTRRESEVLSHLGTGLRNREIANLLRVSTRTVEAHTRKLLRKLGVSTRTEAAIQAVRCGLC